MARNAKYCSFCGRPLADGSVRYVAGPGVAICENCVSTCVDILSNQGEVRVVIPLPCENSKGCAEYRLFPLFMIYLLGHRRNDSTICVENTQTYSIMD